MHAKLRKHTGKYKAFYLRLVTLACVLLTSINSVYGGTDTRVDPELRKRLIAAIEQSNSFDDRFHAEVWLLDMSTRLRVRVEDSETRLRLLRSIHREASKANLPPELVIALIDIESRFDRFAISRSGAQGLMQIMPFWLKEIGHRDDNLMDIDTNLRMGCTILRFYLDKEKGNLRRALARYNGSLGSWVYPDKVMSVLSGRWYKK
ncbi:FIG016425: Soluble lytic murein transglycosylase and related regulatory proteins (some contain LysM/invasin domains) [hydrothermal vent metagenome]|uniref:FIG016425: Soluble lytic murein transglycosylase and related regulatory proteins (Some contain LysM/invasin domains) n=1 Tax=hydrothermal vent metagenome TaxID=652676 RepID=A0A3B0X5I3_9ZZZZ